MNKKIGFIGLGNMGYGMVVNLLKAGYEILANDIDEEKINTIVVKGAQRATQEAIIENAETVILCLPHPDISKEVIANISKGNVKTIIETSTVTPENTQEFAFQLASKNIAYLCAPMLAGSQMALEGNIHFLVEGHIETFEENNELFAAMGHATFMGNVPNATLAKLAYNICRYSNVATALTVIQFLKQYSNNLEPIYKVLVDGSLENFGQVWKEDVGDVMLENKPFKFAGSKIPVKDLSLVTKMAEEKGLSKELFQAIIDTYKELAK